MVCAHNCHAKNLVAVAKIPVKVLLVYALANFGKKKNELELVVRHWLAKKLAFIETRTKSWSMTKNLVG